MSEPCPLCMGDDTGIIVAHAHGSPLLHCGGCGLLFRQRCDWPTRDAEQAHYRLHENAPDDPHYRRFLQPLFDALQPRLPAGAGGLDFGCGPGSALAAMLEEAGHPMERYDPLFAPDRTVLARAGAFAFITASEVVEHLHRPAESLALIDRLLEPGGCLGVMTGRPPDDPEALPRWHYLRDPTHVAFYGTTPMRWIAHHLGWQLALHEGNVALFHKPPG